MPRLARPVCSGLPLRSTADWNCREPTTLLFAGPMELLAGPMDMLADPMCDDAVCRTLEDDAAAPMLPPTSAKELDGGSARPVGDGWHITTEPGALPGALDPMGMAKDDAEVLWWKL